jgi:glycosyltransferase involved in cell wall biosynthesis
MSSVWIVIAAYNEASRIDQTLGSLAGYNTIVVDDGSGENTYELARGSFATP